MKASRSVKLLVTIILIGASGITFFLGLNVFVYVIVSWVFCIIVASILMGFSLIVCKVIIWIWKPNELEQEAVDETKIQQDELIKKIFLTIWLLLSFLAFFFAALVVTISFMKILVLPAVIVLCYGFYRSIKWVWKKEKSDDDLLIVQS